MGSFRALVYYIRNIFSDSSFSFSSENMNIMNSNKSNIRLMIKYVSDGSKLKGDKAGWLRIDPNYKTSWFVQPTYVLETTKNSSGGLVTT